MGKMVVCADFVARVESMQEETQWGPAQVHRGWVKIRPSARIPGPPQGINARTFQRWQERRYFDACLPPEPGRCLRICDSASDGTFITTILRATANAPEQTQHP